MAGEWIKFEASTPEKQEVFSITVAMGWDDPDLTVGKLLKVWRWFDQQTLDGNAPRVTAALLDRIIGVTGFAKAMCDVGWLASDEQGVSLPNFDRHNGQTAKTRALTAKRVAKCKGNADGNAQGNGGSVTEALPKEEKRREDIKEPYGSVTSGKEPPEDALRCPVGEIVNAYHDNMPLNPKVKVLNDARKKTIAARWREAARLNAGPFGYASQADGITAWRDFFAICAESKFLTGQAAPQAGKPPFLADLDFLLSPAGFAKALENKYHRDA